MIRMSINSAKRLGIAKKYIFKDKAIPVLYISKKTKNKSKKQTENKIIFKKDKNVFRLIIHSNKGMNKGDCNEWRL